MTMEIKKHKKKHGQISQNTEMIFGIKLRKMGFKLIMFIIPS